MRKRLAALIAEALPGVLVTSSHQVAREFREFERASTTLSVGLCAAGDRRLPATASRPGWRSRVSRAASRSCNPMAGACRRERCASNAITALCSGPAAGVVGAIRQAARSGFADLITFDMGGTSTDVCLVQDGRAVARLGKRDRRAADPHAGARHRVGRRGRRLAWCGSTTAACCGSVLEAPAPIRGRPATARAAASPPRPTPTS